VRIKYKVAISVVMTLICFNSLFTYYNVYSHKKMKMKELNERIVIKHKFLQETISQTIFDFDAEKTDVYIRSLFRDIDVMSISLHDYSDIINIELTKKEFSGHNVIKDEILLERGERKLGVVTVVYSTELIEADISQFKQSMFFLTGSLVVITLLVLIILLGIVTKPFGRILAGIQYVNTGNLNHRIGFYSRDELGELALALDEMTENLNKITASRDELNREIAFRKQTEEELREAISQIKTLSGFLPICSVCKKIRDDKGYWEQIESYITHHSDAEFSHSMCPDCMNRYYKPVNDSQS